MAQDTQPTTAVTQRVKAVDPAVTQFQKMREQGYNILTPSATFLQNLPQHMQVGFDIITVNTDPAMKEVYNTGTTGAPQLGLGKTVLMKIASAAAIQIDPMLTKRLDDRKDRMYCAYQAVVWYTKPDGTRLGFKAEKEYDLHLIEEKIRDQKKAKATGPYAKQWEKEPGWVEDQTRKELLQIREHVASLCETKAILRAIRGVMAIKTSYTPDELSRPFAIVRVTYRLDYNDPMVRARVLDNALPSAAMLYGQHAAGELAANVESLTYLPASNGLDDDDFVDLGLLNAADARQAVPATVEPAGSTGGEGDPDANREDGVQAGDAADKVVDPPAAKTADAGKSKAGKGKPAETGADAVVYCEDCPTPLTAQQVEDAGKGFPAKCNPCIDKDLGGAA